ncbi:1079_t:CDS:2 [Diversispora eburnea]|uniref:1079_t:CDS:1 n=1 Tax=Diversispora eburnea TaxID=1213867 RepID=A0A9N9F6H5_9GLOM|nr:1079_t:CDS:2 [Diversispora eburnea]
MGRKRSDMLIDSPLNSGPTINQSTDNLLRRIKKKNPNSLTTNAKKRQKKSRMRALMNNEKKEIKVSKSVDKLLKRKKSKNVWE